MRGRSGFERAHELRPTIADRQWPDVARLHEDAFHEGMAAEVKQKDNRLRPA